MILTPHAIVGAALANMFPNEPVLGFGLAFMSHFALDMLPHSQYFYGTPEFIDKETKTIKSIFKHAGAALHLLFVAIDFITAIILCALFFVRDEKSAIATLVGVTGALLPDLASLICHKYNILASLIDKHKEIQNHPEGDANRELWGIFFQIAVPAFFLVIYFLVRFLI